MPARATRVRTLVTAVLVGTLLSCSAGVGAEPVPSAATVGPPALDRSCNDDSDCEHVWLRDDCCFTTCVRGGNKAWAEGMRAYCASLDGEDVGSPVTDTRPPPPASFVQRCGSTIMVACMHELPRCTRGVCI
jgi:hypothetical protein